MKRLFAFALLSATSGLLPSASFAQQKPALEPAHPDLAALPAYVADPTLSGTIHIWGHVFFARVMKDWQDGFTKLQPNVHFENNLVSSAAATGALFTHTAEIGVLGREIRPMEVAGYNRVMRYKPLGIEVVTGACANADKSPALAVFTHAGNPIKQLTYAQLDAIFGTELRRGAPKLLRTWGDLGATGDYADKPIHLYTGEPDASPMFWFSHIVLKDSLLFNPNLSHFDDVDLPGGKSYPGGQAVLDNLAKDPYGLGLSDACFTAPDTQLVAIAEKTEGPFLKPTAENIYTGAYPLTRSGWIYLNKAPAGSKATDVPDALTLAFVRYLLSRQGQEAVLREGDYIPLNPKKDAEALAKLR